jgi:ATP-dependent DNA helicase RecG
MSSLLDQDIQFLPGVGPKRAQILTQEIGVKIYSDLLYHFPYKYSDRSKIYSIKDISSGEAYIQLQGKILSLEVIGEARKQRLTAMFSDGTGVIQLVWFKGIKFLQKSLKPDTEYMLFGKPNLFNSSFNIPHPELEEISKLKKSSYPYIYQASYPTTEKMKNSFISSRVIHRMQQSVLEKVHREINETLPGYVVRKLGFPSLRKALINVHFPSSDEELRKARYRLKFEELFFIQLQLLKQQSIRKERENGCRFSEIGSVFNKFFYDNLPFELTEAQKRVIKEIRKDVGSGKQMNRLLQGDVGSGKTLVALLTILMAIDNGFQACIMAPTEILAQQHYRSFSALLEGLDINFALLTGSTKTSIRKTLHEGLRNGELNILIGTHALIEDTVQFKSLGLAIIDEQHRFGVVQRAKLWEKNFQNPPHVLVMTATPIPRTLAMTMYGDLDVSVIDELPPGRKPIKTHHLYDNKRLQLFSFLETEIAKGRQIYIVYPLIKESENMDYKDLEDGHASITRRFPPPKFAVSVVHGKMKAEEKNKAMKLFTKGLTHIMVSTTVIEVGVDVPNATVMVIESAERFGLSQLHQLRGRVGRGAEQSHCILMSDVKLSKEARTRLNTMVATNDGFEIAEVDLKLRGPGDLEGTQQSGVPFDLHIASLSKDQKILEHAREIAREIIEDDPLLQKNENAILNQGLAKLKLSRQDWSDIS